MAEILFYHLTQSTLDDALPGLVERSLARQWKVTIQFMTDERRDAMDSYLWVYSDDSFIGHGTERDKYPELQPVYLTLGEENPNDSQVRFMVEGANCSNPEKYERLVVMFDGRDPELLAEARKQWKSYKEQNHQLTYWQQTEDRRWEKKA
ncbi:DNA polymerase III subunit chi [Bartonella apis]|uniref:DNA polymerase III subunit chi n=1 Tax=Bartonella apis TaxID=1686310 RepID=UPI000961C6E2|nr:DNA polymerase III subunit chi [Bartonella apis]OLY44980.1 DNA polymerase III, chi subunit [Bartonella apis]OLY47833.1 DNA polymerase III, chi subunit [Bartonella apis]